MYLHVSLIFLSCTLFSHAGSIIIYSPIEALKTNYYVLSYVSFKAHMKTKVLNESWCLLVLNMKYEENNIKVQAFKRDISNKA